MLGIIAEIEQQLGGEGMVGLDFLRSRYIAASSKVYKMIRHLNTISGGRYPLLVSVFNNIRGQIDTALEEHAGGEEARLIVPLPSLEQGSAHLAGNKAANLAELTQAGLPVPPGFVITTGAFRYFMEHTGLAGQLRQALMLMDGSGLSEVEAFSRMVQKKVMAAPLPPDLAEELAEAGQALAGRGDEGLLSLRSSAVGEDSSSSFAGLYRSVLRVPPERIGEAYREVVAALYAPRRWSTAASEACRTRTRRWRCWPRPCSSRWPAG